MRKVGRNTSDITWFFQGVLYRDSSLAASRIVQPTQLQPTQLFTLERPAPSQLCLSRMVMDGAKTEPSSEGMSWTVIAELR